MSLLLLSLALLSPPTLGGCQILPSNHVFNTQIDTLPVHPSSAAFITTIATTPKKLHLDLGQDVDPTSASYYGIPYNLVAGNSFAWKPAPFHSLDPDMSWDPAAESDCADANKTLVRPCTSGHFLPLPDVPLVEGGTTSEQYTAGAWNYGDHHILLIDTDRCQLWETYHSYSPNAAGGWDIFGSAFFDLGSNALRPAGWTSADAAGFPILPLLLRAAEASSGVINHALRFTLNSKSTHAGNKIRGEYVWPARHLTYDDPSLDKPAMGQLFRLKASFVIAATYNTQSKAILQALKSYGMYLADGGSDMYITGEPSAEWLDATFAEVQSVPHTEFEAVDLSPIFTHPMFDANSAAVPGTAAVPPSNSGGSGGAGSGTGTGAPGSSGGTPAASTESSTKRGGCGGGASAALAAPLFWLAQRRKRSSRRG